MDDLEQWLRESNRDLRQQLGSAIDTVMRLREKSASLKIKLVSYVDQGQGLTQEQLVEFYEEINKLFPTRVRCPRDTNGDGNCGRPVCPNCGKHRRERSLDAAL